MCNRADLLSPSRSLVFTIVSFLLECLSRPSSRERSTESARVPTGKHVEMALLARPVAIGRSPDALCHSPPAFVFHSQLFASFFFCVFRWRIYWRKLPSASRGFAEIVPSLFDFFVWSRSLKVWFCPNRVEFCPNRAFVACSLFICAFGARVLFECS